MMPHPSMMSHPGMMPQGPSPFDRLDADHDGKLSKVLLAALGLIVIPLIRGLGLLDRRIVLEEHRLGLRQIEFSIEKSAARKFSGLRVASPFPDQ